MCGKEWTLRSKRVVGGHLLQNNTYNYHTLVTFLFRNQTRICGGTLLNNLYVLTSGSCFLVSFRAFVHLINQILSILRTVDMAVSLIGINL